MEENLVRYSLRLPAHLKEHLEKSAKVNSRSLNNEIVAVLESHAEPYDKNLVTQRLVTSGSTYGARDTICDFIKSNSNITGALLAVRDGELNKSALSIVIYHDGRKTIFDTCLLTAERTPREWEVYDVCNTLDSVGIFTTSRFVTERVKSTKETSAHSAIEYLESYPSQLLASENVYKFLSLFCYEDNISQIPKTIFIENWKSLCGLVKNNDYESHHLEG
jgi:hypothetical protein